MARSNYSYEKRMREIAKKKKKEAKRKRKAERRDGRDGDESVTSEEDSSEGEAEAR
jgi:hypothetical protein